MVPDSQQKKISEKPGKKFVKDLSINDSIDSTFAVKYKRPLRSYAKGYMFNVGLSDKTGEIELTYWGGQDATVAQELWKSFMEGDVIRVKGVVSQYKQKTKIDVNEGKGLIRRIEEYDITDFIARSKRDPDEMMEVLLKEVHAVKEPYLKKLLLSFFEEKEFIEEFKKAPAAMYMHHAYVGGLLEHTLHVLELCAAIHRIYPSMSRDLLVAGAVLHDIGKTKEFEVGTSIKISEDGMLRGHIVIGEELVLEKIRELPSFPKTLKMKIAHMLLSHHGNGEYGSPKDPQFPEAAAVHYADVMDSQVDQYVTIKDTTDSTDFRIYTKRLGELYLK